MALISGCFPQASFL